MLHAGEGDGGDRFYSDVMRLLGEDVGTLRALPMIKAALERARVVGVLDAWATPASGRQYHTTTDGVWLVLCSPHGNRHRTFPNVAGLDAARAAAAEAIEAGEV